MTIRSRRWPAVASRWVEVRSVEPGALALVLSIVLAPHMCGATLTLRESHRFVRAEASTYGSVRCDGSRSNSDAAPGYDLFLTAIQASFPPADWNCPVYGAGTGRATQTSVVSPHAFEASGDAGATLSGQAHSGATTVFEVAFSVDSTLAFSLTGEIDARAVSDGSAAANLGLQHPDGSVDSVNVSAVHTQSDVTRRRTFLLQGDLTPGAYVLRASASTNGGFFIDQAHFELHFLTGRVVAVRSCSWQQVKERYRGSFR